MKELEFNSFLEALCFHYITSIYDCKIVNGVTAFQVEREVNYSAGRSYLNC